MVLPTKRTAGIAPRAAILTLLVLAGCGGPSTVPSGDAARAALEQALNAWKSGSSPGDLPGTTPPVQAVDSTWRAGRKLASFEIVREEPAEDERRFVVRRQIDSEKEPDEVLYIVFGRDPVRVYAEDDYRRLIEMDNNPAPRKKAGRR